jgi:hypothetical protein
MLLWRTDLWNVKHASFVRKLLIAQYLAQLGLVRHSDTREEAFGLIRGLIDAVVLTPADGKLEFELRGDLAGILALSEVGKGKDFPTRAPCRWLPARLATGFEMRFARSGGDFGGL